MIAYLHVGVCAHVPLGQSDRAAREKVRDFIKKALTDRRSGLWPMLIVQATSVELVEHRTTGVDLYEIRQHLAEGYALHADVRALIEEVEGLRAELAIARASC